MGTRRGFYLVSALVIFGAVAALLLTRYDNHVSSSQSAASLPPSRAERKQEAATERRRRQVDEAKLERDVAADARLLAAAGALRGPILRASCISSGSGSSTKLRSYEGRYDCLAVNHNRYVPHHGHIVEGIRFWGTIDFRTDFERFGGG